MAKKELVKRYILLIIGLLFSAFGVAAAKHGELGVSPISSVANIVSIRFDFLSMGTWLIIWNCVLILGQIIILRRDFKPIQLLQIPLSFVFGWFTDLGMWCFSIVPSDIYPVQLGMVVLGVVLLAFGISLAVEADVIMNSGEAFVKDVADKLHKNFGNVVVYLLRRDKGRTRGYCHRCGFHRFYGEIFPQIPWQAYTENAFG